MNLKQYLALIAFGTIVSWAAFFVIIINIDPFTAGTLAFLVLYASLFIGLFGLFSSLSTFVRAIRKGSEKPEGVMKVSLRQGLILAVLVEGSLILSSKNMLTWWMLLLLLAVVGIIEFLALTLSKEA